MPQQPNGPLPISPRRGSTERFAQARRILTRARKTIRKSRERARKRLSENERDKGRFTSGGNYFAGAVCAGGGRAFGAGGGRRRARHSGISGWPGRNANQGGHRRSNYLSDRRWDSRSA